MALIDEEDVELVRMFNWYLDNKGYARTTLNKRDKTHHLYMAHWIMGQHPGMEIDHINGDKLDNRRANLRVVTRSQNLRNRTTCNQYKGVSWNTEKQRWMGFVKHNGKPIYLGYSKDPAEVALKVDDYNREHFGNYAVYNFPRKGERSALTGDIMQKVISV